MTSFAKSPDNRPLNDKGGYTITQRRDGWVVSGGASQTDRQSVVDHYVSEFVKNSGLGATPPASHPAPPSKPTSKKR